MIEVNWFSERKREREIDTSRGTSSGGGASDRNDSDDEKFVWKRGRGISSQKFCIGGIGLQIRGG